MYKMVSFNYNGINISSLFISAYSILDEANFIITGIADRHLEPIFIWELSYKDINSAIECLEAIAKEYPAKRLKRKNKKMEREIK